MCSSFATSGADLRTCCHIPGDSLGAVLSMTLPFGTGFWGHCRHAGLDEVAEKSGSDGSCRGMSVLE